MKNRKNKTIEELLNAFFAGQRHFQNWDFDEDGTIKGINLSGIIFEECFLFLDFRDSNLTNTKFIKCNIKTADFRGSDLTHALIKNCSVESTTFKGAKTDNLIFKENYCYGNVVNQKDFDEIFKDSNEFEQK